VYRDAIQMVVVELSATTDGVDIGYKNKQQLDEDVRKVQ
jgi:hypothetical protein